MSQVVQQEALTRWEIVEKDIQLTKLEKREKIYRGFGITLIVIGGLTFLPFLYSFIQATRVPVPRELILYIGLFIFLIPLAGIGVLLLLRARRLKREIQKIYNSIGIKINLG